MKKLRKITVFLTLLMFVLSGCANKPADGQSVSAEPVVSEKRVSFFGAGDNLIHNSVYFQAARHAGGEGYDFKPMYEMLAEDIESADIAYINQETILGGAELGLSSYPMFNSPQEVGRDMIELGFDVFSQATNHTFDKGEAGVRNTYKFYSENPEVTCVGLYKKGEDNIKIVEKNDVKIAFLNYTYHTNGLSLPKNSDYYVPLADYKNDCEKMIETVKKAEEMADFVVCFLHWGDENTTVPNDIQKNSAKLLSENGCDVIVGTHPHTIQPIEYVGDTLVVYSLGNFISAQTGRKNLLGLTVSFDFVVDGDKKYIDNVCAKPVITHYEQTSTSSFANLRIIPFDKYDTELADSHSVEVNYDYFKNLVESTIDEKYLYKKAE